MPIHLRAVVLSVLAYALLVGQVLSPADIRRVGILDDTLPLLHGAAYCGRRAATRQRALGIARAPPIDKGTGIGRVGNDTANDVFGGPAPADVAHHLTAPEAPRYEDIMLLAVAHDPVARTQGLKRAEDKRDHMLNLLVGIFDNAVIHQAHQTRG